MFVFIAKNNKSQQYIIFNFLKSDTILKVLFALVPVSKDLE